MNAFLSSIAYPSWALHALVLLPLLGAVLIALLPDRYARHVTL